MITKINFIFLFAILCFYTKSLNAVPAFPGHIIFKQQDGSTFIGKQFGDEWFNWIEAEDVAYTVLFLGSDESRCINGTSIFIDNGACI